MKVFWVLLMIFGLMGLCGLGGMGLGLALGTWMPSVYTSQFRGQINPVEYGAGLGLGQGITLGAFLGLGLAGIYTWAGLRSRLRDEVERLNWEVRSLREELTRPPAGEPHEAGRAQPSTPHIKQAPR